MKTLKTFYKSNNKHFNANKVRNMKIKSQNNHLYRVNCYIHHDFCYQFPWFLANPTGFQGPLEPAFLQRQEENNFLTVLHKQGMKFHRIIHGLEWLHVLNFFAWYYSQIYLIPPPSHHILDNVRLINHAHCLLLSLPSPLHSGFYLREL